MRQQQMRAGVIVVVALTLAVHTGCSRRNDDRSITAAPEQAAAPAAAAPASVDSTSPPLAAAASAVRVARNPLAMPLKHDGPVPPGAMDAVDPCARPEPTGPLAMPLKHDGPHAPGQPNPLCMRLK